MVAWGIKLACTGDFSFFDFEIEMVGTKKHARGIVTSGVSMWATKTRKG